MSLEMYTDAENTGAPIVPLVGESRGTVSHATKRVHEESVESHRLETV